MGEGKGIDRGCLHDMGEEKGIDRGCLRDMGRGRE